MTDTFTYIPLLSVLQAMLKNDKIKYLKRYIFSKSVCVCVCVCVCWSELGMPQYRMLMSIGMSWIIMS